MTTIKGKLRHGLFAKPNLVLISKAVENLSHQVGPASLDHQSRYPGDRQRENFGLLMTTWRLALLEGFTYITVIVYVFPKRKVRLTALAIKFTQL